VLPLERVLLRFTALDLSVAIGSHSNICAEAFCNVVAPVRAQGRSQQV
jgi:hypothetical protein